MKINPKKHPIISCVNGYWLQTILCPLLMIGEVIFEVLIPALMADVINSLENGFVVKLSKISVLNWFYTNGMPVDMQFILYSGLIMIAMALLSLTCGGLAAFLSAKAGAGFAMQLRQKIFYTIQNFSFYNIDKFSTASLVTRCTTDVNSVQTCYLQLIRIVFRAPIMLIFGLIMALQINASLSIIFAVALPILAGFFVYMFSKSHPLFKDMLHKYDDMNAGIQENLIGMRVVKSFVREDHERSKFNTITDNVMKSQYKAESLLVLMMPVMQLVMYACKLAIAGIGGRLIYVGGYGFGVGDLSALITYAIQILSSLMMISMIAVTFVMSKASVGRICELFDEQIDIVGADNDNKVTSGKVQFYDVNFSYKKDSTDYVLSNINLEIESGQTVGIIGGTGEGKSSLVQLIPRLYDVSTGCVMVDGRDVREYSLQELRDSVAMVLQKNVLFSGTIRDNLKWGNPDATDEQIEVACRQAQAWDFIESFPNKLDTDLGQGGVNVSGGQKQRLCIARALLKNPKIIILDDSTSAVDTATDEKIRTVFNKEIPHVTKIIIAQRIASISGADKIVVLDKGQISDVGTHEQLLKRNTIYKEVYESQAKGVED